MKRVLTDESKQRGARTLVNSANRRTKTQPLSRFFFGPSRIFVAVSAAGKQAVSRKSSGAVAARGAAAGAGGRGGLGGGEERPSGALGGAAAGRSAAGLGGARGWKAREIRGFFFGGWGGGNHPTSPKKMVLLLFCQLVALNVLFTLGELLVSLESPQKKGVPSTKDRPKSKSVQRLTVAGLPLRP